MRRKLQELTAQPSGPRAGGMSAEPEHCDQALQPFLAQRRALAPVGAARTYNHIRASERTTSPSSEVAVRQVPDHRPGRRAELKILVQVEGLGPFRGAAQFRRPLRRRGGRSKHHHVGSLLPVR